ncbi:MAG: cation:proton antiporter [Erysipelotrichaceae bacterium]
MDTLLISLSLAVLAGLLMSRLAKLVNLPAVTSYLVAGLIIGPYVLNILNNSILDKTEIITSCALGFIAFLIGNEFRISDLKAMGRQAFIVGIGQALITTVIVDLGLIILHYLFPDIIGISSAIVLGAIAAATAPAATLMVVKQYKASGPLTKLLLMVVAIDDAVGLVVFALSFGIASALESGSLSLTSILIEPLTELIATVLLGVLMGLIMNKVEIYFHSRSKRLSVAVAFVVLTVGIASTSFKIGTVNVSFSLLLCCMLLGAVFCNICDASEELMDRADRWSSPLNILFFVISGAQLNLGVISNSTVLLLGLLFILLRTVGKISGAYLSSRFSKCSDEIQKYLGITLLPQAGVALGMAAEAAELVQGDVIRNVVLFSVLIYELIGPNLTKMALIKAHEINPEVEKNINTRIPNSSQKTGTPKSA